MTNPLDEHLETFQAARDAIKVVRRVLDERDNPVSNTRFYGQKPDEAHKILDQVEEQISTLVAFALFATFERLLRDHLSMTLDPLGATSTIPAELATNLHKYLPEGVDNWRIDKVIEMFKPPVPTPDVSNALGIRKYRNRIAHGATPQSSMPPQIVHTQLSEFLKNAGLV